MPLLQVLEEEGSAAEAHAASPPAPLRETPDLHAELRGIFHELVESIPKDVMRELKRTKDALRPSFWGTLHALQGLHGGQAESTAQEPMVGGERLTVHNAWGDVRVVAASGGVLRVKATRRVWAAGGDEAQRLAESLSVVPRRRGDEVVVDVRSLEGRRVRVDLELEVPPGVASTLRLAKGDVRVDSVSGPVRVDVIRGDVRVGDLRGAAEISVTSGDVHAESVDGDLSVDVRSGDVQLAGVAGVFGRVLSGDVEIDRCGRLTLDIIHGDVSIDQVTGDIAVDAKSGDLRVQRVQSQAVRCRTLSGDVTVAMTVLAVNASVSLETLSGDIRLQLPQDAHASIDAVVGSGEVDCALPLRSQTGDRRSVRGILNGPGATVTLRATSGDIDIGAAS
jgi:DUF4097 and DUF4098 domain-containing protein YvlB